MSIAYGSHTCATTRFRGSFIVNEIWPGGIYWNTYTFRGTRFPDSLVSVLKGLNVAGFLKCLTNRLQQIIRHHIRTPTL